MHAAALARVLLLVSAGLIGSSAAYAMLHSEERTLLPSVDEVLSWKQRGVIIVDPAKFQTMKKQFLTAGLSKVQVIADFDRTISKSRMEPGGPHTQTSHGIIETSPFMPQEYKEQAKALKDKYFPFEYDPKIPTDKKYRLMQEWWDNAHLLITKYKLNKQIISKSVNASLVKLRDRFDEMVNLLHTHEVPLLVFSAGLAETIDEFLRKEGLLKHNMFVVGNRMHFDGTGAVVRFDDPVIHSLNKNYGRVRDTPFVKRVRSQNRNLVILLGDNVADNKMVEGMKPEELKNVLRIGFLNDNIDKLLEDYKKVFDIVILNDGSMDFPFELLKEIAQAHPNDPITTCKALGRIPETAASNLPSESGQSHSDSSSSSSMSSSSNSLNPPQAPRIAQTQTQSANASSSSASSSSSSSQSALVEVQTASASSSGGGGGGSSAASRLFAVLPYEEISEH